VGDWLCLQAAAQEDDFKTEPGNFVMELPPNHLPTFMESSCITWHKAQGLCPESRKDYPDGDIFINILQLIYAQSFWLRTG
jgi:Fe2+ transport system protein B